MSTQTVFRFTSFTGIQNLHPFLEPIPTPLPHELLIKIHSVALNGRDVNIANSQYPLPVKDNVVPGSDMCGVVAGIGDRVKGFELGEVVINCLNPGGTETFGALRDGVLREYMVLPAVSVIKVPSSGPGQTVNYSQWASLVQAGSTVWNALYGNKRLMPGDTVLVLGTGGVSLIALIIAKAAGATTIITSSSDAKLSLVSEKYGIDHGINYNTHPNWSTEVQRLTNGKGADHIIESTGAGNMAQNLESVARAGVISIIGFLSSVRQDQMPDVAMGALRKGCVVRGIQRGSKQQLEDAVRFMGNRGLIMPVEKSFPFTRDGIIEGLKYLEEGKHVGKVCIDLE